jgi:ABC-type antimicrobial peptide transport system ATPase subunit
VGIYPPHDLETTYQTRRNIVMLYCNSVVEASEVALVVKPPHYPYMQFFTSSIPLASTERTWTT